MDNRKIEIIFDLETIPDILDLEKALKIDKPDPNRDLIVCIGLYDIIQNKIEIIPKDFSKFFNLNENDNYNKVVTKIKNKQNFLLKNLRGKITKFDR